MPNSARGILELPADPKDTVDYLDQLIQQAIRYQASDIHFEPFQHEYRIRLRIDGILHLGTQTPLSFADRLAGRLKVLARIDTTETRRPQDGRFRFARDLCTRDCRVSTCPTLFGEKIVVRLLDPMKGALKLEDLGMASQSLEQLKSALQASQGLILVTGPTGSGKTVTLYAALNALNQTHRNIVTVEDPAEIGLPGINQVNVRPKLGLDFATVLRAFLRQDPDVMMIGEIRDQETAEIAMKAAQTGHLVLATLHTNTSIAALWRLQHLDISAVNIVSSVSLIIAQRLVRRLCPLCKSPVGDGQENEGQMYEPQGCIQCLQGYRGRTGIFEVLPVTDALASAFLSTSEYMALRRVVKDEGFQCLTQAAQNKVNQGETSVAEVHRVLQ